MRIFKKVYGFISTLPFWISVIVALLLFGVNWSTGNMPNIWSALMDQVLGVFSQFSGFPVVRDAVQQVATLMGISSPWINVVANFFSWFLACRVFYWLYLALTVVFENITKWLEGKLC